MISADRRQKNISLPYVLICLSVLPVFILSFVFPANAHGDGYIWFDQFIDDWLFGRVGLGSSLFPFMAKVVGNYVALAAPLFSVWLTVLVAKRSNFCLDRIFALSHYRYWMMLVGWVLIDVLLIYQVCFNYTDLSMGGEKFAFLA